MKFGRLLLFFLLAVIITTAVLSFMLPASQKIERSIVINTSAATIYNQLVQLENFNKFSVWSQQDSTAIYTISGTDGTVGTVGVVGAVTTGVLDLQTDGCPAQVHPV